MHLYAPKRTRGIRVIVSVLLAAAIVLAGVWVFFRIAGRTAEEQRQLTEREIRRALVTCYAVEGAYPFSLTYLEEHYGLVINHQRYVVSYDCLAVNLFPDVRVAERGSGEHAAA